ncbi:small RNA 2'-O-methyltransferase [Brachyistius frenatus]|uniref:small RNA 2'-O-methyltransferase n=1 Tax=Brachyistius frenatus TaxID=100188 RepID=UPI0037E78F8C
MEPMFTPALHKQRHQFVIDFVKRKKPKKVADLGCSKCRLLKKLKFQREIELLVGMDLNAAKLKKKMKGLSPVSTDYLQPTYEKLRIEMYQGSVTEKDSRLRGFDLMTIIELIEHLVPDDLERFGAVVFGYMAPQDVIVSTPNSEFNHLLPGLTGFRHTDHKFEWTRAEFKTWAQTVCSQYGYEVELTGLGEAPQGRQESVGFCSHVGVFHRISKSNVLPGDSGDVLSYTLLYSIDYPSLHDNKVLQRVLVNEVVYWMEKMKDKWLEEEKHGKTDDALTPCQTEGGEKEKEKEKEEEKEDDDEEDEEDEEEYTASACGAEMKTPVDPCGEGVSHQGDEAPGEVRWTSGQRHQETSTLHGCVSVPLALLWSRCPRVAALSGSVGNLRHLLTDNPKVELSQNCSCVLVHSRQRDQEEEEEEEEKADKSKDYAEGSQGSHQVEQGDEWETNV